MTRQKSNRRQGPGPACTYFPKGVRGGVAGAGPGQGPCTLGARKLHTLPLHDWPLWPRGLMGWSLPSQSGAPGSPFIHKKSRRKRSAARPGAAWNFEVRARLVEPMREYGKAVSLEARLVQGPALPGSQFRPSNRVWRALHQGHIAPGSAQDPIRTRLPPSSSRIALSHLARREAASICDSKVHAGGPAAAAATCALSKAPPTALSQSCWPLTAVVLVAVVGAVIILVASPHRGDAAFVPAPELILFAFLDRPCAGRGE